MQLVREQRSRRAGAVHACTVNARARIRGALTDSTHFRSLPDPVLQRLSHWARLWRVRHGHRVAEHGHDLWIVLDGAVRIGARLEFGRACVHAVLGRGSYFGLAAAIGEEPVRLEAHAVGPTELARIDGVRLRAMLKSQPHLWRWISGLLSQRLDLAISLIEDDSLRSLRERVARNLLRHAASRHLEDCSRPDLRITQTDLARMCNASRSRTFEEMRRLRRAGLVEIGYRAIKLLDIPGLRLLAGEVHAF